MTSSSTTDTGVAVTGAGRLADAVRVSVELVDDRSTQLEITVSDAWPVPAEPPVRPRIDVHTELGRVVIGPYERPGIPGCAQCVRWRRGHARQAPRQFDQIVENNRDLLAARPSAWLTALAAATVGAITADEVRRLGRGAPPRTDGAILLVDLADLTVSRHRYLPDPRCPACGQLPDDTAEAARIVFTPQRKLAPDVARIRSIEDDLDMLEDTFIDPEMGFIPHIDRGTLGGLIVVSAPFRVPDGNLVEIGGGRSRSYRASELVAILEALERLGGARPGGKRTTVRASLADLRGQAALDPRTVGLHPESSYATAGFLFRRFTEREVCHWVWGYSLTRESPVLVPETLVYYRLDQRTPTGRGFCYEISNGCALGSGLAEAILHGVLEVVERDAFLLTWYARVPVARFDLDSARDTEVRLTAAAIEAQTGFRVSAFDTTMEAGIPSVWALALNPAGVWPAATCAAGSSLDPQRAVLNALRELGPTVEQHLARPPADEQRAARMVDDPTMVITMDDHSLLYAHPAALERFAFLTGATETRAVPSLIDPAFRHDDLVDDLRCVLDRFTRAGLEVIVVDQTTLEHRAAGLACVKVLVPGAIPMTFGYSHRRIDGLDRLLDVPYKLGYTRHRSTYDDLNPHPHPFP
ncbi:TOMM precursor leader peptide-binding protein [Nocardia sp. NPDC058480]|uniref:TOMM precursor leader peptide-binding protein n=1 Tax=Nocardia sp. NPDC058480 TaxID=3346522 RepID=UPI0036472379